MSRQVPFLSYLWYRQHASLNFIEGVLLSTCYTSYHTLYNQNCFLRLFTYKNRCGGTFRYTVKLAFKYAHSLQVDIHYLSTNLHTHVHLKISKRLRDFDMHLCVCTHTQTHSSLCMSTCVWQRVPACFQLALWRPIWSLEFHETG